MWRKIWMVLYKPSSTGVGRLELYTHNNPFPEQKKGIWQKTPEKKVVRLSDCLSITPALTESCPPGCTAFYLTTTQCNFVLASTESEQWLSVLCLLTSQVTPALLFTNFLIFFLVVLSLGKGRCRPYQRQIAQWGSYYRISNFCHFTSPILVRAQVLLCVLPLWSRKTAIRS